MKYLVIFMFGDFGGIIIDQDATRKDSYSSVGNSMIIA